MFARITGMDKQDNVHKLIKRIMNWGYNYDTGVQ